MRTSTSRRRPTSRAEFDQLLHQMRKHRLSPEKTDEQKAEWVERQTRIGMDWIKKHGGR